MATNGCNHNPSRIPDSRCEAGCLSWRLAAWLRHSPLSLVRVVLLAVMLHEPGYAIGVSAGTDISNTATTDYMIAGAAASAASNTVTLRVDEKIDVNVTWQDAGNIGVSTPDTGQVLAYLLTNTGNGSDRYSLAVQNNPGGDQFDPVFADIYLDTNDNGIFDPGVDVLYVSGSNDPVLAADASQVIFVRNNIPGSLNTGDLGNSRLVATSGTGGGLPGTAFANAGDNNTVAVIGTTGGTADDTGVYEVSNVAVALLKSAVITDPQGGNQPVPGATITYSIDVTIAGPGVASGVMISDPLPVDTTYSSGTLTLNTVSLTDGVDADAGDFNGTAPNTVAVNLGDLTPASPVQTIMFEVTIN
ncbi:MAG: hypothetical protein WBQ78_02940 [Gammaproteobacteria bacterium]